MTFLIGSSTTRSTSYGRSGLRANSERQRAELTPLYNFVPMCLRSFFGEISIAKGGNLVYISEEQKSEDPGAPGFRCAQQRTEGRGQKL